MDHIEIEHGLVRQVPQTPFEQALLKKLLDASGCFEPGRIVLWESDRPVCIEPEAWQADGRLAGLLVIEPVAPNFRTLLSDVETYPIYLSVNERAERVVLLWEMPANPYSPQTQSSEWGYQPVLTQPAMKE